MKTRFEVQRLIATIAIALFWMSLGRANAGSLSLEAHEIGSQGISHSNWETDWGSYDRTYTNGKRLLVTVRDMSQRIASCDVAVYFIAHPAFRPTLRFIYDRQSFSPQFRGRTEISGPVNAQSLHSRIQNYATLGETYSSGADFDGWVVVGRSNGEIFDVKASSQTLLEIAQENPRQQQSLAKMVATYERVPDARHASQPARPRPNPEPSPAIAASPPSGPKTAVLAAPIVIQAQQGSTTLPIGTSVELVSQDASNARIRYSGRDLIIPSYAIANPK